MGTAAAGIRGGRGSEKSDPGRMGSEYFMTKPGSKRWVKHTLYNKFVDFVAQVILGHEFSDPTRKLTRVRADPRPPLAGIRSNERSRVRTRNGHSFFSFFVHVIFCNYFCSNHACVDARGKMMQKLAIL